MVLQSKLRFLKRNLNPGFQKNDKINVVFLFLRPKSSENVKTYAPFITYSSEKGKTFFFHVGKL
jgi:hypothetical protein